MEKHDEQKAAPIAGCRFLFRHVRPEHITPAPPKRSFRESGFEMFFRAGSARRYNASRRSRIVRPLRQLTEQHTRIEVNLDFDRTIASPSRPRSGRGAERAAADAASPLPIE